MAEIDATNAKLRETRDRPVPLLLTRLPEGWAQEFRQLTRREIDRPALRDDEWGPDE
jgi:hypothetical protein